MWQPNSYNPADLASRGVFPQDLIVQELWWKDPPWLTDSPVQWPIRVDIGDLPPAKNSSSPHSAGH